MTLVWLREHMAAAQMYVHLAALLRKFSAAKTLSPMLPAETGGETNYKQIN